jgi:F-type H+-transporting ATPase subunit c
MDLLVSALALVEEPAAQVINFGLKQGLAALGAGLCIVGGGFGIGRLAASAMESISRQPEAAGDIRGGMILAAALIEGVTLLALITCILAIVLK